MINLPPSFDLVLFTSDLVAIISPIVGVLWMFVVFAVIVKLARKL